MNIIRRIASGSTEGALPVIVGKYDLRYHAWKKQATRKGILEEKNISAVHQKNTVAENNIYHFDRR